MVYFCFIKAGGNWVTSAKIKMATSIEKALDNKFSINRKGTKRRNDFSYNTFERPVTHLDFFNLLHNSGINLTSFELTKYMCHTFAADYVVNNKSDVKLIVASSYAQIVFKNAEWLNIMLDRSNLVNMLSWFQDQSLFHTDFINSK